MFLTAATAVPGTVLTSRARALATPLGAAGAVAVATVALHRTGGHDLGPLATSSSRSTATPRMARGWLR
jgi:hypothetical protein